MGRNRGCGKSTARSEGAELGEKLTSQGVGVRGREPGKGFKKSTARSEGDELREKLTSQGVREGIFEREGQIEGGG